MLIALPNACRAEVISRLPGLQVLDGRAVGPEEPRQAVQALRHLQVVMSLMLTNACLVHKLVCTACSSMCSSMQISHCLWRLRPPVSHLIVYSSQGIINVTWNARATDAAQPLSESALRLQQHPEKTSQQSCRAGNNTSRPVPCCQALA